MSTLTVEKPHTKTSQARVTEWTQGSGISPELAQKWVEQETDPVKIAHLLGWKIYNHTGGWYVRTCDPITGKRGGSGQFKPDEPIIFPDSDKPAKYFSFPKGGESDPLFSVMILNDWVEISERTGVPIENEDIDESREDLGFWSWVIKHPELPIAITEGAKKAGCLLSHSHIAIALCGVWNGQKQRKLHPWLKHFIVPGRPVYLAFDADIIEKESVAAALKQFGRLCLNEKASVFIISWPLELGKGVDDLIVNHGEAVFRMALSNSTDYSSFIKKLEKQFNKNNNSNNNGAGNGKIPPADVIGAQMADEYNEHLKYCGELASWLYYGLESEGVWTLISDDYMAHIVDRLLEAQNIRGYGHNSYITSIIGKMKRQNFVKEWPEKPLSEFYPFNNGVYEIKTGKLHPHSPGFHLTWKLPRDFNLLATEWPNIDKWLTQATGGKQENKDLLLCFAAAVLRGRYDLQKFLYLIGSGGSGKSTYANLVTLLIGEHNTVNLDLCNLDDKHEVIRLFGKRLLICSDQDKVGRKLSNFKKLTGGDRLSGRELYKSSMSFWYKGLSIITSNPPSIFPASTADWLMRRQILINFNHKLSRGQGDDFLIRDKFEPELPALTNYLLQIPDYVLETTLKNLNKPEINAETWEQQTRTDGLAAWVNDWLVEDKESFTMIGSNSHEWGGPEYNPYKSSLYGSYALYCRQTGRTAKTTQNFSADLIEVLERVLGWKVNKTRRRRDGTIVRGIEGIKLRSPDLDIPLVEEILEQGEQRVIPPPTVTIQKSEQLETLISQGVDPFQEFNSNGSGSNLDVICEPESIHNNGVSNKLATSENPLANIPNAALLPYLNCIGRRVQSTVTSKYGVVMGLSLGEAVVFLHVQLDDGVHIPMDPANLVNEQGQPVVQVAQVVTPPSEPDWSSYPHPTSNDIRAAQNRANQVKEGLLKASDRHQLESLKQQFSRNELTWVYRYLLTDTQRQSIKKVANTEQLSLFEG